MPGCTIFWTETFTLLISATEQLSITLQGVDTTIQEAVQASKLALTYLQRQRKEDSFETFYDQVLKLSKDFTDEPTLPRYSKRPRRIDDGEASHRFESPKAYFKQLYFEAIDLCHGELTQRFHQTKLNGMPVAAALEKLLLDAANGTLADTCEISEILTLYAKFIDIPQLTIQLKMIPDLVKAYNDKHPPIHTMTNVHTLCEILNSLSSSKTMFSQVCELVKTVLTVPVTTATAEHSFSALRRLKTFLRSSMLQTTLNYVMLLHVYKERTDNLDILHIAKQFISVNEGRRKFFGTF